jgi:hypothetical protein
MQLALSGCRGKNGQTARTAFGVARLFHPADPHDERYTTEAFFRVKAEYFKKWSEQNNPFHPEIWVWGAGRKTRQRARLLEKEGLKIQGFIDIVKGKTTQKTTLHFSEIPSGRNVYCAHGGQIRCTRIDSKEFD